MMDYKRAYEDLKQQIDNRRYEDEQRERRDYRQRKEKHHQALRDYQESLCYADGWLEAFSKGLIKYRKEAGEEQADADKYPDLPGFQDGFFRDTLKEVELASRLYNEEMKPAEERIQRIRERAERLIAAVEQQARDRAAARLDEQFPNSHTAEALRNDDHLYLCNW